MVDAAESTIKPNSPVSEPAASGGPTAGQAPPAAVEAPRPVDLDESARRLALEAAVSDAGTPTSVGGYLGADAEDDVAVTARFAATQRGYVGWQWSVTLAFLPGNPATVSEVVLLPGADALLAPVWVPWEQRIRPGDVGAGDLLPPPADDPRLVPAYVQSDDPAVEAVARELGIGRVRVMSRDGRADFAERLHEGPFGPDDQIAVAAPATCATCAFFLPLAGSLRALLGGCGNEFSPADGRVVDQGYGCGAHSETVLEMPARSAAADAVIDELQLEMHRRAPSHAGTSLWEASEPSEQDPAGFDPDEMGAALADPEFADPGAEIAADEVDGLLEEVDAPVDPAPDDH